MHIRDNVESIAFIQEQPEKANNKEDWVRWSEIQFTNNLESNNRCNETIYKLCWKLLSIPNNGIPYFRGDIDYGRFIQASFAFGW